MALPNFGSDMAGHRSRAGSLQAAITIIIGNIYININIRFYNILGVRLRAIISNGRFSVFDNNRTFFTRLYALMAINLENIPLYLTNFQ